MYYKRRVVTRMPGKKVSQCEEGMHSSRSQMERGEMGGCW
jgi:hypothetical protein